MTGEEVDRMRKENNNIEVKYVFDEKESHNEFGIPNPVQTFKQAFCVSELKLVNKLSHRRRKYIVSISIFSITLRF